MERWGVIYSPKQGVLHTHRRWERIRQMLTDRGIEYDFVQSEGALAEQRLAAMLAKNGYTTIVVVGGDGALNRVVNGVAKELGEERLGTIRFGLIPNGHGNDFATFWGLNADNEELSVETLFKGRVRRVDLGITRCGNGEKHYFLNCVNVGLASSIFSVKYRSHRLRLFAAISYLINTFVLLFHRLDSRVRMRINHEEVDRRLMTLCVSSCRGYGQTPNAVPYNGMLDVSAVHQPRVTQLFHGLVLLLRGHFLNFKDAQIYRTNGVVEILDTGGAKLSVDGQVLPVVEAPFHIYVRHEAVQFIIP